jgi:tripartite-type tricarboxylate transporter receptor subunit TctC
MLQHSARWTGMAVVACLAMTPVCATDARAQHKTMTLIIGGSPGSAYNIYGRTLARHITRHLPGAPDVIVKNLHGAGGSIAAEYMDTQAPNDGSLFALLPAGALIDPLFQPGRFKYDPNRFEYLGTMDQDTRVCVTAARSPVKTFNDARTHQAIIAGTQPGSTTVDYPNMLNVRAGTRFKLVQGYRGTSDVLLAIDRGEADGMCTFLSSLASVRPQWLGTGEANVFVQIALNPHPDAVTYKIPSVFDFVSADVRQVIELIATQQVFGRPVALPAGTPPAQVATLRAAFMATMKDPEFLAEATKVKLDINPLDGEGVAALLKKMYAAPPDMVERMAKALKPAS